ncbi:phosphohistidine phosphatase SixA [Pseudomonas sp. JDS28PS106]|uniref:phosphohistidine phosphatase SixA n=1 Tax=Pseudomonas sp. JDS28PS106 TaxID=2497235 RepID=UPI002FCF07E1
MKLWVLRHGEAQPKAASDPARELTAHGRDQVLHSAARLRGAALVRIIASPYVRARQTAELVRQALDFARPVEIVDWLTPDSDPRGVLAQLDALDGESVLLVSHQPLVGALVGLLAHGSYRHAEPMGTASLAELEGEDVIAGGMELLGLHHGD